MEPVHDFQSVTELLMRAGCVAAEDEAIELLSTTSGNQTLLAQMIARRVTGEPLAWITGRVTFCQTEILVDTGVYVPRWQSEPLALRAVERLSPTGRAVDLCTGSGAIAKVIKSWQPLAQVLATDLDTRAVNCARSNGIDTYQGDLLASIPNALHHMIDVIVGVVPYVPTPSLPLLARDTLTFESTLSYDGGDDGMHLLRRAAAEAASMLAPGGALLLELGGDQAEAFAGFLATLGYVEITVLFDEEGDERGIEAIADHPS